ncbi:MAG: collagen-like protein [Candidatus Nomurabacteria bacterium]|nr:collagen-like protein [Candidatus Nomurabacteria bacterium]
MRKLYIVIMVLGLVALMPKNGKAQKNHLPYITWLNEGGMSDNDRSNDRNMTIPEVIDYVKDGIAPDGALILRFHSEVAQEMLATAEKNEPGKYKTIEDLLVAIKNSAYTIDLEPGDSIKTACLYEDPDKIFDPVVGGEIRYKKRVVVTYKDGEKEQVLVMPTQDGGYYSLGCIGCGIQPYVLVYDASADTVTTPPANYTPPALDPQNIAGANGATGTQGVGNNGNNGNNGIQGPAGIAGANGQNGYNGYNGVPGKTGATGPQGPTGPAGSNDSESYYAKKDRERREQEDARARELADARHKYELRKINLENEEDLVEIEGRIAVNRAETSRDANEIVFDYNEKIRDSDRENRKDEFKFIIDKAVPLGKEECQNCGANATQTQTTTIPAQANYQYATQEPNSSNVVYRVVTQGQAAGMSEYERKSLRVAKWHASGAWVTGLIQSATGIVNSVNLNRIRRQLSGQQFGSRTVYNNRSYYQSSTGQIIDGGPSGNGTHGQGQGGPPSGNFTLSGSRGR